jgi:AcrR family transcriptional regulator
MTATPEATPTKPRWERRKEARPAELVSAALDLFVEKGYAGTRLDDVAARAGVSKGTLYLYFENKEELFKAVVRENIVARISQSADEALHYDGSSAELLSRLITNWWKEYGSSTAGGISKLMMAESGNFPEIARFFLDEVIEPWHRMLAAVIQRGAERGNFETSGPRCSRAWSRDPWSCSRCGNIHSAPAASNRSMPMSTSPRIWTSCCRPCGRPERAVHATERMNRGANSSRSAKMH